MWAENWTKARRLPFKCTNSAPSYLTVCHPSFDTDSTYLSVSSNTYLLVTINLWSWLSLFFLMQWLQLPAVCILQCDINLQNCCQAFLWVQCWLNSYFPFWISDRSFLWYVVMTNFSVNLSFFFSPPPWASLIIFSLRLQFSLLQRIAEPQ